ncbi:putative OTU like cysteine protease [Trypanosoma vivax]|uniref:OTU domain-containing protein n=1 Tax=Trypanosoma vivax (strain Y486) TaxID=1055687 RepID=G0TV92_TRYVY|nr:hypothetical protein TRVL_05722 [Trypanosoma vivax]KAH8613959.1 putative OTU like cysteine protease [Trypanosoma vivax]CCC47858.1 conserved hypothetical protein [Trypanosoma vivax Y486]
MRDRDAYTCTNEGNKELHSELQTGTCGGSLSSITPCRGSVTCVTTPKANQSRAMQLLRELIRRKAERLCSSSQVDDPQATHHIVEVVGERKVGSQPGYLCWLCGRQTLFHIDENEVVLCLSCFRRAYLALILPYIKESKRQESDSRFVSKILHLIDTEEERSCIPKARIAPCRLRRQTVEVRHPSETGFNSVLERPNSSHGCVKKAQGGGDEKRGDGKAMGVSTPRVSGRCTYTNVSDSNVCTASHFEHADTVRCSSCQAMCKAVDERPSRCPVTNALHIAWTCRSCRGSNMLEADECSHCSKVFMWDCVWCTKRQESRRTPEGLWACCSCGAFNTPVDVARSLISARQAVHGARLESSEVGTHQQENEEVIFGVNDPATIAEQARQRELGEGKMRLERRLRELGVEDVSRQTSDGNCMFRALSNQLLGRPDFHLIVRRLVVEYMRDYSCNYKFLFDGEEEWNAYLNKMSQSGYWGDELCLNAAACCFHADIHVITSSATRWHLVFRYGTLRGDRRASQCGEAAVKARKPESKSICLFLVYLAPVHYDDITPRCSQEVSLKSKLFGRLIEMLKEESPPTINRLAKIPVPTERDELVGARPSLTHRMCDGSIEEVRNPDVCCRIQFRQFRPSLPCEPFRPLVAEGCQHIPVNQALQQSHCVGRRHRGTAPPITVTQSYQGPLVSSAPRGSARVSGQRMHPELPNHNNSLFQHNVLPRRDSAMPRGRFS